MQRLAVERSRVQKLRGGDLLGHRRASCLNWFSLWRSLRRRIATELDRLRPPAEGTYC